MSNEVLTAWWQEVCAELGVPAPTHYIRATMRDLKDAKKIREILSASDLYAEFLLAAPLPAPNEVTSG